MTITTNPTTEQSEATADLFQSITSDIMFQVAHGADPVFCDRGRRGGRFRLEVPVRVYLTAEELDALYAMRESQFGGDPDEA